MFVHLPQRLDVQLAATPANPHGRLVHVVPDAFGFAELPDDDRELLDHPVIRRLLPQSESEAARVVARRDAAIARADAIARAESDFRALITKIDQEAHAEVAKLQAEWAARRDAALSANQPFDEPSPDAEGHTAAAHTGPAPRIHASVLAQVGDQNAPAAASRVVRPDEPPPPPAEPADPPADAKSKKSK